MSGSVSKKKKPSTYDFHFDNLDFVTFMLLRHTWWSVHKVTKQRLSRAGLTLDMLAVLWAGRDYPGILTPTIIAQLLSIKKPTVTRLLDMVERKRLVTTLPKSKGHPYREVKLTPQGEKVCARGTEIVRVTVERLMSDLSPEEIELLQHLLRPLRDHSLSQVDLKAEPVPGFASGQVIPLNW